MKPHILFTVFAAVVACLSSGCVSLKPSLEAEVGQHAQSFEKEITMTARARYWLYVPEEYAASDREWPLVLFLHGAGERGDDLEKVTIHGPPKLIAKEGKTFPFIIVSPQCPAGEWWTDVHQVQSLNALLDDLVSRYRIDKDRVYLTGLSMGGFGTWVLAATYPDRFAAIAPVCGAGNRWSAKRIAHIPAWVFHGAKDGVVPLACSEDMVAALKKVDCDVRLTVYPDAHHDSWTETYSNPELYEWFLEHKRSRAR
jgi:predicted peptidase